MADPIERTCVVCASLFEVSRSSSPRMYCKPACGVTAFCQRKRAARHARGLKSRYEPEAQRLKALARYGKAPSLRQTLVQCAGCPVQFNPKRTGQRYHSRECAFAEWGREKAQRIVRLKAEPTRARKLTELKARPCECCGATFSFRWVGPTLCVPCRRVRLRQLNRDRQRVKWRSERAIPWAERQATCLECGNPFNTGRLRAQFCKPRCGQDYSRRVHRARCRAKGISNERFDPLAVLRRDRWRCQLCGVATPERLRGTKARNAPELDHIIPLAAGGRHTTANTQCACRACNGAKGKRVRGQLRLELSA